MSRPSLLSSVAALLIAVPVLASAVDLADGKLSVDGNGAWAFKKTDHNAYLVADPNGNWATAMFDLLLAARVTPELTLTAQAGFEPPSAESEEGSTVLEWAFAEWRISDLARLRAGKVKHPFGNYAELQFVGTARPFFDLPTAVYGPSDVAATSYSGVGLTGRWQHASGFGLEYDAYGGAMDVAVFAPWEAAAGIAPAPDEELIENVVGGRMSLTTPWDVAVRLSGFRGVERRPAPASDSTFSAFGPSVFYRGEKLWLSFEAFRASESGAHALLSAYGEAAWMLDEHLQLAARYEWSRVERSLDAESAPSRLLRHDEAALGVSWWFTPQAVAKVSVHQIWGERFATPALGMTPSADATLLVVAGTQFSF